MRVMGRTVGRPAPGAHTRARVLRPATDPSPLCMPAPFRVGSLEVNVLRQTVQLGGETHALTPSALRLLCLLAANAGRVLTRGEIWAALERTAPEPTSNVVDATVAKLRRELRDDVGHPRVVETVIGRGYRFVASD
jgi:DNA-binding response OmpR family regulator